MEKKFVAVLNKSAELRVLLNALGHITAGLAGNSGAAGEMGFLSYFDGAGNEYPHISRHPFIILQGGTGKMRQLRAALIEASLPCACFLDTMIAGGSDAQVSATAVKQPDELGMLAIATFGPREVLDPLTRKFSVWTGTA